MPPAVQAILIAVFMLAASVWVGGYVATAVMARVATTTLQPGDRVTFFRALGRAYLWVEVPALVIALVIGGVLLADRGWDPLARVIAVVGVVLAAMLAIAIAQARRMTVLRRRALDAPAEQMNAEVRQGAVWAGVLRALLGVLTLAIVVLGTFAVVF